MDIVREFLNTRVSEKHPYDNSQKINSQMWNPEWKYHRHYNALVHVLAWVFGYKRAYNIASEQSYWWGRGQEPNLLASIVSMSANQLWTGLDTVLFRLTGDGDLT